MAVQINGFGDSSHGSARSGTIGAGGLRIEVWDITNADDVTATLAVPTRLSRLMYASGQVSEVTQTDVSSLGRNSTYASLCSGGWVDFSFGDISAGATSTVRTIAIGW